MFTSLASEDSGSLRASLAAYADLLGRRFVIENASNKLLAASHAEVFRALVPVRCS